MSALRPLYAAFCLATVIATSIQCGKNRDGAPLPTRASAAAAPTVTTQTVTTPKAATATAKADAVAPPPDALRILISGSMLGRLEPCGCASGQLGGLARRIQHIGEQRNYDLLLEGGDLVAGDTELDKLKLLTASQVLFAMEHTYDVVGVGARDLALPLEEWSGFLLGGPAVATNLRCEDPMWPATPFRDKQVRAHQIRIASLLLDELPEKLRGADAKVTRTEAAPAWADAFAGSDDAVIRIAMVHGRDDAIRALIPKLAPRPDLVIGIDQGYIEPDSSPAEVAGVPLVFAGIRGRVLLDARLWRDEGVSRVACELVPLAGSKTVPGGGGDPNVKAFLMTHREDVARENVLEQMAEQAPTPNGAKYVGTATCGGCHPTAMKSWQASKHAHAWQTLVDAEKDPTRYGWPVTKYPDCVSCHVVGYGQQTGFISYEKTPHLADVGCERCHGPGLDHVASGGKKRLGIIGGVTPSVMCTQCHDYEQSPQFVYSERWKVITHGKEPR